LQEGAAEEGAEQQQERHVQAPDHLLELLEEAAPEEGVHHVRRRPREEGEEGEEGELLVATACMEELVVLIVVEGEA